jgi:hypothetical protein
MTNTSLLTTIQNNSTGTRVGYYPGYLPAGYNIHVNCCFKDSDKQYLYRVQQFLGSIVSTLRKDYGIRFPGGGQVFIKDFIKTCRQRLISNKMPDVWYGLQLINSYDSTTKTNTVRLRLRAFNLCFDIDSKPIGFSQANQLFNEVCFKEDGMITKYLYYCELQELLNNE